jgi:hypothetical protein
MSKPIERVEIITGRERRRRYSAGEKVRTAPGLPEAPTVERMER